MDLEAYSWACGSTIRCIAESQDNNDPAQENDAEKKRSEEKAVLGAQGLVSVWAAAVRVAAELGDVEDIEEELGPHAAAILSASKFAWNDDDEAEISEEEDSCRMEAAPDERVLTEAPPQPQPGLMQLQALPPDKNEKVEEAVEGLDGFLGLLSAWSDDAPASRLLEEARHSKTQGLVHHKASLGRAPEPRGGKPLSKDSLAKLRERFPQSRAPSPPAETRHWRRLDFELYFGPALSRLNIS